jgi:BMFP domain-containing protein YqiC
MSEYSTCPSCGSSEGQGHYADCPGGLTEDNARLTARVKELEGDLNIMRLQRDAKRFTDGNTALTARVKEQDQIIALMRAACLPSEEEVKHAEAWLAANPDAPYSDYVPLAKETENAALTARVKELEAALATVMGTRTHGMNMSWEERCKIGCAALTPAQDALTRGQHE